MRGILLAAVFLLGLESQVFSQWDYNQHVIDNIIESRIDRRKTQKRIQARKRNNSASGAKAGAGKTGAGKPAARKPDPLPRTPLKINRDTFQQFHLNEGYSVDFTFMPINNPAGVITKSFKFSMWEGATEYNDLPEGVYTLTAQAEYGGKKYKVYIATEANTFEDQTGGNFAPSQTFEIKQMIDSYGSKVIGSDPGTLYIRVIE